MTCALDAIQSVLFLSFLDHLLSFGICANRLNLLVISTDYDYSPGQLSRFFMWIHQSSLLKVDTITNGIKLVCMHQSISTADNEWSSWTSYRILLTNYLLFCPYRTLVSKSAMFSLLDICPTKDSPIATRHGLHDSKQNCSSF